MASRSWFAAWVVELGAVFAEVSSEGGGGGWEAEERLAEMDSSVATGVSSVGP